MFRFRQIDKFLRWLDERTIHVRLHISVPHRRIQVHTVLIIQFSDFAIGEFNRRDALNPRSHLLPEEPAGTGTCFHGQCEGSKVRGSFVDFHAIQVVFENQSGNVARRVAFLLVNLIQQIERVCEHMAGATCRIAYGEFFGRRDGKHVLLLNDITRCGLNVIVPIPVQLAVGVGLHPKPTDRVLHQVAHNPVRGEQLGRGGNLIRPGLAVLLEPVHHFVFTFRNVILVQPADDLHIAGRIIGAAILRGHGLHRIPQHRTFGEQIRGHEHLINPAGFLDANVFKHERQVTTPIAAFRLQQQTVSVFRQINPRVVTS